MSKEETKTTLVALMDKADELQIANADKAVQQAMVYKTKGGDKQLTYIGLKHLTLLMSQKGQPLEVLEFSVKLDKQEGAQIDWHWYATYKVRNQKTGHESVGMSEANYLDGGKYDPFGRTKALSKAERNAWRKQLPELAIVELIKTATKEGSVEEIKTITKDCTCLDGGRYGKNSRICLECGGKDTK